MINTINDIKEFLEDLITTINTDLSLSLNSEVDVTYAYSFEELLNNTPQANSIGLSWLGSTFENPYNNNTFLSINHRFILVISSNDALSILEKINTLFNGEYKINNRAYTIQLKSYAPKPANDITKLTIYADLQINE